jgi:hypothetical protein
MKYQYPTSWRICEHWSKLAPPNGQWISPFFPLQIGDTPLADSKKLIETDRFGRSKSDPPKLVEDGSSVTISDCDYKWRLKFEAMAFTTDISSREYPPMMYIKKFKRID